MDHNHGDKAGENLKIAFILNLFFAILEFAGGLWTNSIAIMSDALHDFGDSLSLGLSWYLNKKSLKSVSSRYTYGYKRFSLLGALINSIILLIGSFFIIREALERIGSPESIKPEGMIAFAVIGIIVNGYAAYRLHSGTSLNEKVVRIHLLEDVLGWVAVLVGAIILLFADLPWIDSILSIVITVFILYNVVKRLKQTLHIFLQGVPNELNSEVIKGELFKIEGVQKISQFHLWSVDGESHVLTVTLVVQGVEDLNKVQKLKKEARDIIMAHNIDRSTVELEF